jgi:flagellar basal-body rod protein FlgB
MTEPLFTDKGMLSAEFALNGLAKRQEIIGRNLSNVDTPGYKAQSVSFESALQTALRSNDQLRMQTTNVAHLAAPQEQVGVQLTSRQGGSQRADGNNVDIDVELSQMAESGIRYQALAQLVSKKIIILRSIAK